MLRHIYVATHRRKTALRVNALGQFNFDREFAPAYVNYSQSCSARKVQIRTLTTTTDVSICQNTRESMMSLMMSYALNLFSEVIADIYDVSLTL